MKMVIYFKRTKIIRVVFLMIMGNVLSIEKDKGCLKIPKTSVLFEVVETFERAVIRL
jgi:hypothetical protein